MDTIEGLRSLHGQQDTLFRHAFRVTSPATLAEFVVAVQAAVDECFGVRDADLALCLVSAALSYASCMITVLTTLALVPPQTCPVGSGALYNVCEEGHKFAYMAALEERIAESHDIVDASLESGIQEDYEEEEEEDEVDYSEEVAVVDENGGSSIGSHKGVAASLDFKQQRRTSVVERLRMSLGIDGTPVRARHSSSQRSLARSSFTGGGGSNSPAMMRSESSVTLASASSAIHGFARPEEAAGEKSGAAAAPSDARGQPLISISVTRVGRPSDASPVSGTVGLMGVNFSPSGVGASITFAHSQSTKVAARSYYAPHDIADGHPHFGRMMDAAARAIHSGAFLQAGSFAEQTESAPDGAPGRGLSSLIAVPIPLALDFAQEKKLAQFSSSHTVTHDTAPTLVSSVGALVMSTSRHSLLRAESATTRRGSVDNLSVPAQLAELVSAGLYRLESETRARYTRARSQGLFSMIQAVAHEVTVPEIIKRIIAVAYELLSADRVSVFLVDKERQQLVLAISEDAAGLRLPMGKGIVGHCAMTGEAVNIADAYNSPLFDPSFDVKTGYVTRSVLAFPIHYGNEGVVAIIQAINKRPKRGKLSAERDERTLGFRDSDVRTLGIVAGTAGVTLHKAKLLQDAVIARASNAALIDIFNLSTDPEAYSDLDTLTRILTGVAYRLVDAERILLFLVDAVKGELFAQQPESRTARRVAREPARMLRVPLGQSIAGGVALSGTTVSTTDLMPNEGYGVVARNVLCMPIALDVPGSRTSRTSRRPAVTSGRVVGVLYCVNRRGESAFSSSDETMLTAVCHKVASVLDKGMLQLVFAKTIAEEVDHEGEGGGGKASASEADGAGRMGSLLGEYVKGAGAGAVTAAEPGLGPSASERDLRMGSDRTLLRHGSRRSRRSSDADAEGASSRRGSTGGQGGRPPLPFHATSPERLGKRAEGGSETAALASIVVRYDEGGFSPGLGLTPLYLSGAVDMQSDRSSSSSTGSPSGRPLSAEKASVPASLPSAGRAGVGEKSAEGPAPWWLMADAPRLGRRREEASEPLSWSWDVLREDDLLLVSSVLDMMHCVGVLGSIGLDTGAVHSFLDRVRVAYRDNPYHNWKHGISVVRDSPPLCALRAALTSASPTRRRTCASSPSSTRLLLLFPSPPSSASRSYCVPSATTWITGGATMRLSRTPSPRSPSRTTTCQCWRTTTRPSCSSSSAWAQTRAARGEGTPSPSWACHELTSPGSAARPSPASLQLT